MTLTTADDPAGRPVTVWTLEMLRPTDLKPADPPRVEAVLHEERTSIAEVSRFYYRSVGSAWSWVDRDGWTDDQWAAWVDRPGHRLLSCSVSGEAAGYVEFDQVGTDVEIAYFGLLPEFVGRGLGGWLLTEAVRHAWTMPGARRVWVHTCSLDAPPALKNYTARGFAICGIDTEFRRVTA